MVLALDQQRIESAQPVVAPRASTGARAIHARRFELISSASHRLVDS